MVEQAPVLLLIVPLFGALLTTLLGLKNERFCLPLTLGTLAGTLLIAVTLLVRVADEGALQYFLGNWSAPRGAGIEFRIDQINGLVLILISAVSFLTALYSATRVEEEAPGKTPQFYTLYLLLTTGLLGMTITADAFNLYVLLEVTSLTGYALVAIGTRRRAAVAAFNYVIIGTVGASLYLLGVGYLFIKTGALNMAAIQEILVRQNLFASPTIHVAFILIMLGVWIKMALFPLYSWLPNAYTFGPSTTACLVAPLMTKVSIYIMIRMMLTVFGPQYVFQLPWSQIVPWAAVVAIAAGSLFALSQTNFRRMLCFIIVAEVGYMVGGAWLANHYGMVGAVYHIISDGFMTLCLFLAAGIVAAKTGSTSLNGFRDLFRKMPITMSAFILGALSIIGIPPTCGFFSKLYLIRGGLEAGRYEFVAALLVSSLVSAVLFFRIIEIAYYGPDKARSDHHHPEPPPAPVDEAPLSMLLPLVASALCLLLLGLYNQKVVALIEAALTGLALVGGTR